MLFVIISFVLIFVGKYLSLKGNASRVSINKIVSSEDKPTPSRIQTTPHRADKYRQEDSGLENAEFVKSDGNNGLTKDDNEAKYDDDVDYDDPDKGSRMYYTDNYDHPDDTENNIDNDYDNDYRSDNNDDIYDDDDDHDNDSPDDIEDDEYDADDLNDYRNKDDYDYESDDDDKDNVQKAEHTINTIKNYNKVLPVHHGVSIAKT